MVDEKYSLVSSRLPDHGYLWHLYGTCVISEKILKIIGYNSKEDKARREELTDLFFEGKYGDLESLLGSNLITIDDSIIPIKTAPYFRSLRILLRKI